jgi:hypothetical protein
LTQKPSLRELFSQAAVRIARATSPLWAPFVDNRREAIEAVRYAFSPARERAAIDAQRERGAEHERRVAGQEAARAAELCAVVENHLFGHPAAGILGLPPAVAGSALESVSRGFRRLMFTAHGAGHIEADGTVSVNGKRHPHFIPDTIARDLGCGAATSRKIWGWICDLAGSGEARNIVPEFSLEPALNGGLSLHNNLAYHDERLGPEVRRKLHAAFWSVDKGEALGERAWKARGPKGP